MEEKQHLTHSTYTDESWQKHYAENSDHSIEGNDLLVMVRAFNEEKSITNVLEELSSLPFHIVVINDGSSDATSSLCAKMGVKTLNLPFNQGLAGAFQAGMRYAFLHGYTYAFQFDADGQHIADYIQPMLGKMQSHLQNGSEIDMLIGSRALHTENGSTERNMGTMRSLGARIHQLLIRMTTGVNITDPTSGMRLYNRVMINAYANQFNIGPEPDMLAYLIRCGARVEEYPVKMRQRTSGESYFNAWNSIPYMVKMMISIGVVQFVRPKVAIR